MNGEYLLHADAVGDAADGEGLLNTAVLLGDDGALKDLDTLAGAFLDLHVHADGVAHLHLGDFRFQRSLFSALIRSMDISSCLYRRSCRHVCGAHSIPEAPAAEDRPFLRHDRISYPIPISQVFVFGRWCRPLNTSRAHRENGGRGWANAQVIRRPLPSRCSTGVTGSREPSAFWVNVASGTVSFPATVANAPVTAS